MLHYYLNLFDGKMEPAWAVMQTAKNQFEQFERYLRNAIEALKKKEISAEWKPIKTANIAQLGIIGAVYEHQKTATIKIVNNEKGWYHLEAAMPSPAFDVPLRYKSGEEKGEVFISPDDFSNKRIKLPVEITTFDKVILDFDEVRLIPAWVIPHRGGSICGVSGKTYKITDVQNDTIEIEGHISKNEDLFFNGEKTDYDITKQSTKIEGAQIVDETDTAVIYYAADSQHNAAPLPAVRLPSYLDIDALCFEDGRKLEFKRIDGLKIKIANEADYNKTVSAKTIKSAINIKFSIKELAKTDKEAYAIQLCEMNNGKENASEFEILSPLRYFFEDDIEIKNNINSDKYKILEGNEKENKVILKKWDEKIRRFIPCRPPENSTLTVSVNTYPLRKQIEAISTLKRTPTKYQKTLIQLFEKREKVIWEKPANVAIGDDEWMVIRDSARSGCAEQRQFVQKALGSPDFAILEGPPGSGKTTVILELICQLVKRGDRILLCGSTHVAIDNILERLVEEREGASLINKLNILPVRIGDASRIDDAAKPFQLDRLKEENNIEEELLLDIANLVCGTTVGILQHPRFKQRNTPYGKQSAHEAPIIPEFDYLIVDESSKTTFQEFLIPALYAKKWILAGDIKQLSPFTDQGDIIANLENLPVEGGILENALQEAAFFLDKLKESLAKGKRFVLPLAPGVIRHVYSELACDERQKEFEDNFFVFISDTIIENKTNNIVVRRPENINTLELDVSGMIVIDEALLENLIDAMPPTHAIPRLGAWKDKKHAYLYNACQGRNAAASFALVDDLNKYFLERTWAAEIAWRIDREYQLRQSSNSKSYLSDKIKNLLPRSKNQESLDNAINLIASMAFPSILESLVGGIKGRKTKDESTITEGFKASDIEQRKTRLVYQHRMHPEISSFPRRQFYENNALQDLDKPIAEKREWNYSRYAKRNIWINVDGHGDFHGGRHNEEEARVMMRELKEFIKFAEKTPPPEGKEWTVACLTFYRGQEKYMREGKQTKHGRIEGLRDISGHREGVSRFVLHKNDESKRQINISLHTVDKFQGHEADIVFLSMVQTDRDGFLDNPNRLNVAITRAKFQLVILGKYEYYHNRSRSRDLKELANDMEVRHENQT